MIEALLSSYKSVIVLDGDISKTFPELRLNVVVIAADGAGSRVNADYIVGDGDSLDERFTSRLVLNPDQNTTDFEKCIEFAKSKDLLPALVIGMGGGEIDHVLGNAQVLLKHAEKCSLFFLDAFSKGLKIGQRCG
jgi:thiamine pyrophosphokinase